MKYKDKKKPKSISEKRFDMEAYEREARQRTAWAQYGITMSVIRAEKEEAEYEDAKLHRNKKKIKEIEEKRKKRQNMLCIY